MSSRQEVTATPERRGNQASIPSDLESIFTPEQSLALRKIENFGWRLAFVRQSRFTPTITVVVSPDRERFAVLEPDGKVNTDHGIGLRR